MFLQSLDEYYENETNKNENRKRKEPDIFSLEEIYKKALEHITANERKEAIEILVELNNHRLLVINNELASKQNHHIHNNKHIEKTNISQRSREYSIQMKKCVLGNLAKLYDNEENYNKAIECYRSLFLLDQHNTSVCNDYAVCLFEHGQIIKSYKLFMCCIELSPTHWTSYEYLLVCFYIMKDIRMCFEIMRRIALKVDLFIASYVVCYLFLNEDNIDESSLFYNRTTVNAIMEEYNARFESKLCFIRRKLEGYTSILTKNHAKIEQSLAVICIDREFCKNQSIGIQWDYPFKCYLSVGQLLLNIYKEYVTESMDSLQFTVDLYEMHFENIINNEVLSVKKLQLTSEQPDVVIIESDTSISESEPSIIVKHVTRHQTRTTKENVTICKGLYEKFYAILKELITKVKETLDSNINQMFEIDTNRIEHETPLPIDELSTNNGDNHMAQYNSNIFQIDIDTFFEKNSKKIVYLEIVNRYLIEFIKYDANLLLYEWSQDLCNCYLELGQILFKYRTIQPIWILDDTTATNDYILNGLIILRVLELGFIWKGTTTLISNVVVECDSHIDPLNAMLDYIETIIIYFKVKLQSELSSGIDNNKSNFMMVTIIRYNWLLIHYHDLMNDHNYIQCEHQFVKCKETMDKFNISIVRIFHQPQLCISHSQIDTFLNNLRIKQKLDNFRLFIESKNYIDALNILKSCDITVPKRMYNEHGGNIMDKWFDSNIHHGNMIKHVASLIICYDGLEDYANLIECSNSAIYFCINDYNKSDMEYTDKDLHILQVKELFKEWDIEKIFGLLALCFKRYQHCGILLGDDILLNNEKISLNSNHFVDTLSQLTTLLGILLKLHGDKWVDEMIVMCLKCLWLLTKSLAIINSKNIQTKVNQTVFNIADESINILMENDQICCHYSLAKCFLVDVLLDLNNIYHNNSVLRRVHGNILQLGEIDETIGSKDLSSVDSCNTLENTFMEETYRNIMFLYYGCLVGYPFSNKIKNLPRKSVIHCNDRGTSNNTESFPFSLIMAAYELFKPVEKVSLGPYLFKVSSSIIGNVRPALTNDLYKLFQVLSNYIIKELESIYYNFSIEHQRIIDFIKCKKHSKTTPLFILKNRRSTTIPMHLYNSRIILQFLIEYYLKISLVQGRKILDDALKYISYYLYLAPKDYFGWWSIFCYQIYMINFKVADLNDSHGMINISTDSNSSRLNIGIDRNRQRKLVNMARFAMSSLEMAIDMCNDYRHQFIMRLDLARVVYLFSTYEFSFYLFGGRCEVHPMAIKPDNTSVSNDIIAQTREHMNRLSSEKIEEICTLYNGNGTQDKLISSTFWFIFHMKYMCHSAYDVNTINTQYSMELIIMTLEAYLQSFNSSFQHLDKFLIQQNLSDPIKCFYQITFDIFNCMYYHYKSCAFKHPTNEICPASCDCTSIRTAFESIVKCILKTEKNQESTHFIISLKEHRNKFNLNNTYIQPFISSNYSCQLHGHNVCVNVCDQFLINLLNNFMIYVLIILRRFYSNYSYVDLLTRYLYQRSSKCCLVLKFIQYLITGSCIYFDDIYDSIPTEYTMYNNNYQRFGYSKIIKYLKPTYQGIINLHSKGLLFKHAWRSGIEEIESHDDFKTSITNIFKLFIKILEELCSKDDHLIAKIALRMDSNIVRTYLLPLESVKIIKELYFTLINRAIELRNSFQSNNNPSSIADIEQLHKYLYISFKVYKSNFIFEKSKRNDLLTCLHVIYNKLVPKSNLHINEYQSFFSSQQKKELLDHVNKYLSQIKFSL